MLLVISICQFFIWSIYIYIYIYKITESFPEILNFHAYCSSYFDSMQSM